MRNIKAKALAMGLVTSLAMGLAVMPGATAFAATTVTGLGSVGSGVTVKGYQDAVYDINITWGDMTFCYRENPNKGEKDWFPVENENDGNNTEYLTSVNKLTVTNNSDVPVKGKFAFDTTGSTISGVSGNFHNIYADEFYEFDAKGGMYATKDTWFFPSGKPTNLTATDYEGAKVLGKVTLTISNVE